MRAESPPPRLPSPDIPYIPLNPPPRRLTAQAQSCGDLRHKARTALNKTSSRSSLKPSTGRIASSPPPTPRSLLSPSPPRSPSCKPMHRRSLSFAIPYRSPPASPVFAAPPPPVPPIPDFVLSLSDKRPVLQTPPQSPLVSPIHIPELHSTSPSVSKSRLPKPIAGMTCFSFFKARNAGHPQTRTVRAL